MSIICPKCKMESHHPVDEKSQWCPSCNRFHYALEHQEPIHFNSIINNIQSKLRGHMAEGSPFSLQLEQFMEDGRLHWRALVKIGSGVYKHSRHPQQTPRDALRELSQIMEEGL